MSEAAHAFSQKMETVSQTAQTLMDKLGRLAAVAEQNIPRIEEAEAMARGLVQDAEDAAGRSRAATYHVDNSLAEIGKPEVISPAQSSMNTAKFEAKEVKEGLGQVETKLGLLATQTGTEATRLNELAQQMTDGKAAVVKLMLGTGIEDRQEPTVSNVQAYAAQLALDARSSY